MESKTFDINTVKGLKQAEQYKSKLENKYDKVLVVTVGWNRVRITGKN